MEYKLELPEGYVPLPLPGRDEWLAELRSGKYKQGSNKLCKITDGVAKHCCLGVLCTLQHRPQVFHTYVVDFDDRAEALAYANPLYTHLNATGRFPELVTVTAFQEDASHEGLTSLAQCNDAELSFEQIADIIEKVWSNTEKNW